MKFMLVVLLSLSFNVKAHDEITLNTILRHCEKDDLKGLALVKAGEECLRKTGYTKAELSGEFSQKRVGVQWGDADCPLYFKTQIEARYKCMNENESTDYCMEECGRSCMERPVFCGSW